MNGNMENLSEIVLKKSLSNLIKLWSNCPDWILLTFVENEPGKIRAVNILWAAVSNVKTPW